MAPSKAKVIEQLSSVKNLGESYATAAYEDLGVRTLDDLIEAAKAGKLRTIKGIGPAKEKAILKSAEELAGASAPAPEAKAKKEAPKKDAKKPKKEAPKKDTKKPKKEAPKKEAKKEAPKKEAPKKEEPKKEEPKAKAAAKPAQERPRTTYRPPQPKPRPSIPGLIFKLTKKIIGRILS